MFDYCRLGGRGLLCVLGWTAAGLLPLHAGRVLIDFGTSSLPTPSPDPAGRHWNSAGLPAGSATGFSKLDLADDTGKATGFSLTMTSPVLGAFDSGDNAQELYPPTAGKDRWSLEKGKVDSATLVVSGLDPSQAYDFHFFGVRDAPISFVSKYEVNGKAVTLAANNNRGNLGTVAGVKPDGEGRAVIQYSIADGPNAHLSVLEVTWSGVAPTQPGQFSAAYRPAPPPPPPAPPKPAPAPVVQAPKPAPTPAPPPAPAVSTPAPAKVAAAPAKTAAASAGSGKGLLFAGIALVLLGLGLAGFSAFKLFAGK